MTTVRKLSQLLSRHLGVDVVPYAAKLVRAGLLPRVGERVKDVKKQRAAKLIEARQ